MLRIIDTALELIRLCRPIADAVGRKDPALAKQFRDALSSVTLNLAEGSSQRGARRTNHYAIALGSAREAYAALGTAGAWGHIDGVPDVVERKFRHVMGTIAKLVIG